MHARTVSKSLHACTVSKRLQNRLFFPSHAGAGHRSHLLRTRCPQIQKIAHLRFPDVPKNQTLRMLFECNLGRLSNRPPQGPTQLLRSALHPSMLLIMNHVQTMELINQCYAYVSYMPGDVGALLMNLREATANTREGVDLAPRWKIGQLLWDSGILNNRIIAMVKELVRFMSYDQLLGPYPAEDPLMQHRWHLDAIQMLLHYPYPGVSFDSRAPWDDPKSGALTLPGE